MNRIMNMMFGAFVGRFLKEKIRRGSIQALKGYLQAIKVVRLGLLGLFGLGAVAAVLVSGIVLTIVGIVALLPISTTAMAITVLVIGLLFALGSGIGLMMGFSQKRWLEMSKSYELMDAVLAPWPGMLPPNPVDVVKGRAPVRHNYAASTPTSQNSVYDEYSSSQLGVPVP